MGNASVSFVLCHEEFDHRLVDSCFQEEAEALTDLEIRYDLVDFVALKQQDGAAAVRRVRSAAQPTIAIYRGWMLAEAEYAVLHAALQTKNLTLLNTPAQYAHCHYLPNCYARIEAFTPKSIWIPNHEVRELDEIVAQVQAFGPKAAIVKDYVKSRKHEWHEACFIPSTSDADAVRRVVTNFIERQGNDLQGGLIFREFIPLLPAGTHPQSGMPLTQEWRSLVLDGQVIETAPYWDVQFYCESPPMQKLEAVLANVKSRFFSCDVAQAADGNWWIIELGDAQVAGLPPTTKPEVFFRRVTERVSHE